jgi:hypothetical protein
MSSGEASPTIWSFYANFKSFISLKIDCFHSLWTRKYLHSITKLSGWLRHWEWVRTPCFQLLQQVWDKLLSPCYKVDDDNRSPTSCSNKTARNKLLRVSCHQFVNNLLRANDIRLVGTACLRVCWPHQPCYILLISCEIFMRVREAANISSTYSFESECFFRGTKNRT